MSKEERNKETKETNLGQRPKILIVDDNPDILEILQINLEIEGYEVETAKGPEDIENLYSDDSNLPDLIVLDVLLDGKDGREICKKLKSHENTGNIPVLIMSAHPSVTKFWQESKADDFVAKPFDLEDFLSAIERNILKAPTK